MQLCPKCNSELKTVPAGISKAGKPYSAFIACTNRECKYTENIKAQAIPIKQDKAVNWDEIAEGKVRHAFALEAYKNGAELDFTTATNIRNWTYFVMNNRLPKEETPQSDDEINIADVPF